MPSRTPSQWHTFLGDADESSIINSDSDCVIMCSANKLAAFAEAVRREALQDGYNNAHAEMLSIRLGRAPLAATSKEYQRSLGIQQAAMLGNIAPGLLGKREEDAE